MPPQTSKSLAFPTFERIETLDHLDEILRAIMEELTAAYRRVDRGGGTAGESFWAEVTGNNADGPPWTYTWRETAYAGDGASYTGWNPVAGGRTGSSAYNAGEEGHDHTEAVPTGSVVWLRAVTVTDDDSTEYWFEVANLYFWS